MQPCMWLRLVNKFLDTYVDDSVDFVIVFFRFELVVSSVNVFLDVARG
jgi:hypothetical protein